MAKTRKTPAKPGTRAARRGAGRTPSSPAKRLLTGKELARALDVHAVTVKKWVQDGCPVAKRGKTGRASLYDPDEVQAWRRTRERASAFGAVAAEKVQNLKLDRELKEIEKQKRLGLLVPLEEVDRRWAGIVAAVRERILSLPGTALQQGIIPPEREDALIALCDEALTDLAARGAMATKGAA